jgi:hypothetical protein
MNDTDPLPCVNAPSFTINIPESTGGGGVGPESSSSQEMMNRLQESSSRTDKTLLILFIAGCLMEKKRQCIAGPKARQFTRTTLPPKVYT